MKILTIKSANGVVTMRVPSWVKALAFWCKKNPGVFYTYTVEKA